MMSKNKITVINGVVEIELKNMAGHVVGIAMADEEYLDEIKKYSWYLHSVGYCVSRSKGQCVYLHRLVVKQGKHIDHINGNKLDNRSANLRSATCSQNIANSGPRKSSKTGVKGVHPYKGGRRFCAQITCNRKIYSLGVFDSIEDARKAYEQKSIELFGEFAKY